MKKSKFFGLFLITFSVIFMAYLTFNLSSPNFGEPYCFSKTLSGIQQSQLVTPSYLSNCDNQGNFYLVDVNSSQLNFYKTISTSLIISILLLLIGGYLYAKK